MKYLIRIVLSIFFCGFLYNIQAQENIIYYDAGYKPATAANYFYKRIIKYKEPLMTVSTGVGYYGGFTTTATPSGLHYCSITEYYRSGNPSVTALAISSNIGCTDYNFQGEAVFYYENGNLKERANYTSGKIDGIRIEYDPTGKESNREYYIKGVKLEKNRFDVKSSPLVGTWRHITYYSQPTQWTAGVIDTELTCNFLSNSILECFQKSVSKGNSNGFRSWKYTPIDRNNGLYEEWIGNDLMVRADIRFITSNQAEFTFTFVADNPNLRGTKNVFTR